MKQKYSGINIQFPISTQILSGSKSIETRFYPIAKHLVGKRIVMIETPGKTGDFRSRIVAFITFDESIPYASLSAFRRDYAKHLVDKGSPWDWQNGKIKWAWPIKELIVFKKPKELTRRSGIVYAKNILVETESSS
jgi:hypothetical protein